MITKHLIITRLPRSVNKFTSIEYVRIDNYNFVFISNPNVNYIYVYHIKPSTLSVFYITNIVLKLDNDNSIDVYYKTDDVELQLTYNPFMTKYAFSSDSVLYLDPLSHFNNFDEFYYELNLQDILDNFKYVETTNLAEMIMKNNANIKDKKYRYVGFISPIVTEEEPYYEKSYIRYLE